MNEFDITEARTLCECNSRLPAKNNEIAVPGGLLRAGQRSEIT